MLLQSSRGRCGNRQLSLLDFSAPAPRATRSGLRPSLATSFLPIGQGRSWPPNETRHWREEAPSSLGSWPLQRLVAVGAEEVGGPGRAASGAGLPKSAFPPRAHHAAVSDLGGVQSRGREALPRRPYEGKLQTGPVPRSPALGQRVFPTVGSACGASAPWEALGVCRG